MPEETPTSAVRDVVQALSPIGLWFATITAFTALVAWSYHDVKWLDWPPQLLAVTFGWCCIAAAVPPYIVAIQVGVAAYEAVGWYMTADPDEVGLKERAVPVARAKPDA